MANCPEPTPAPWFRWKRWFDFPMAAVLALPAIPLFLLAALAVKLTSKGPCIYKQIRCGLDGKVFTLYKIRSMRVDAEAATGAVWCARKDHRVTSVGKILRLSHLDELPQLYNVLRGDMALVGPRPERPEFVKELDKRIDGYSYRMNVKPGVTGLAQINQASDIDLSDVRRKLVYDFEYIEHANFWMDIILIAQTVLKVFTKARPFKRPVVTNMHWAPFLSVKYSEPHDEERLSQILTKQTAK